MAKAKKETSGATKVRLLVDCIHGKADDVVELMGDELTLFINGGYCDADPAAVAYAESLKD